MGVLAQNSPNPISDGFQQPQLDQPPLPPLPVATNTNIVDAVNAIRQVVQQLGSPKTLPKGNNQSGSNSGRPGDNKSKKNQDKQQAARWTEQSRKTVQVRVYNPDDHDQYVDVEQIDQLIMVDKITGATWTWNR
jgi:hypothetical protein